MIFGILTLMVALSISAVAAYYSIVGLAAIFSAAVFPIVVMGTVLEVGKIVTTVWLHTFWERTGKLLRSYLITAVIALMVITSMGVFGFLSKAHIEQASNAESAIAEIETIEQEIIRQQEIIQTNNNEILRLQTQGTSSNAAIQTQIDLEQERIDQAYERIQPQIDALQFRIDETNKLSRDQIQLKEQLLVELDRALAAGEIATVQSIVGANPDGVIGSTTRRLIDEYRSRIQDDIIKIQEPDPDTNAARTEIQRLRDQVASQIENSNETINRLREQLSASSGEQVEEEIAELQERNSSSRKTIEELTQEKFALQRDVRQLEAEVGPIKYVAELLYEEADTSALEQAVRVVIIIIVLVFDPLAICLVLAGTNQISWSRETKRKELRVQLEEYQKIVDELDALLATKDKSIRDLQTQISRLQQQKIDLEDTISKNLDHAQKVRDMRETVERLQDEIEKRDSAIARISEKYNIVPKNESVKPIGPDLDVTMNSSSFGTEFPAEAIENDYFLRVDFLPSRLYRYGKGKWLEVDKETEKNVSFDTQYIEYLIERIDSNELALEELSASEQQQITSYLNKEATVEK